MATLGSTAYQLDLYGEEQHAPNRYDFSVMEGGGRRTRAQRQAVSPGAVLARMVVAFVVMFAVLGGVRVTLSVMTVNCLNDISQATTDVSTARLECTKLEAERSQLLSADRIQRIATENYGMAFATSVDKISVRDEFLHASSADDEQPAEGAEGDGDVA